MGMQIRDDRQMKALTGLSQAQFDHLLPVFNDLYQAIQHKTYEEGVESGTRTRQPGGGAKGQLPTMAEKLLFVLFSYKTYPTFDVLGAQFEMVRSKAHQHLHPRFRTMHASLSNFWVPLQSLYQGGDYATLISPCHPTQAATVPHTGLRSLGSGRGHV